MDEKIFTMDDKIIIDIDFGSLNQNVMVIKNNLIQKYNFSMTEIYDFFEKIIELAITNEVYNIKIHSAFPFSKGLISQFNYKLNQVQDKYNLKNKINIGVI